MDFLWVRWFGPDRHQCAGFKARWLDHIGFITKEDDTEPFGFIDPALVIRAVHLIPAFAFEKTQEHLQLSVARGKVQIEWNYYYVNRYAL
jgi:hypothetical protein